MKKRGSLLRFFFLVILGFAGSQAAAQQLTRFAVVDLSRVYLAFFRESRAVREFEERSARVQSDIDRMNREIQDLKLTLANMELQGSQDQVLRLENEINRKSDFLREYFKVKTAEL